jgi:amino acid transporter
MAASSASESAPRLRRALGLWDLILYGIILIQPTAPMPLFGVVYGKANGHVVTTILIAMVAMMFTAFSYGRMARAYPAAGSAYTYVGREIHPSLGYITGWSMLMDYVLNPVICVIWCAKAAGNVLGGVPLAVWVVFFVVVFTLLNLRGIQSTARTNQMLAVGMGMVIVWFLAAAVRYLLGGTLEAGWFLRPFYDPGTWQTPLVLKGTSLAVLTYIGFDGISTLSEEVHNPKRNVLLATVLVCLIIGLLSAVECWTAQAVWPAGKGFPNIETAYVFIAGHVGGTPLFHVVNVTLLVASIGSGMGGHLGAARLLYGMGRDNAIPRRIFGYIDPKNHIPRNNVILVGALVLIGAFLMTYELGAEMLNFGAFIAFMGVNAASFLHYFVRGRDRSWSHAVIPVLGFVICFVIWLNLQPMAKLVGAAWVLLGLLYGAWKTQGFRRPISFEVPES